MIAFVFPGQGSQYVGMSAKIPESSIKKELFNKASEILGFDLLEICEKGPQELLTSTDITQPALYTVSSIYDVLLKEKGIKPQIVAGHSLGEYSALYSAEAISFETGLKLVRTRGLLMKSASDKAPGKMLAVIGLDKDKIQKLLEEASKFGVIVNANNNAFDQVVLSGSVEAIMEAQKIAKDLGARLSKPLEVSAAFHSPLMEPVVPEMSKAIDEAEFKTPSIPIIQNVTAEPETDINHIKENLKKQLTGSVNWVGSVLKMDSIGVKEYYEVGPKNVLKGLIERIIKGSTVKLSEEAFNA
ncbi:ACP S-malonyltransferase [Caldisericum exile]|uniref:Malonyl CoA-acyl carrier protein transacylase n=1 Tax=Caldisericum exile (strain DSM 21853 / NBRC 104410 / AZM16c01) TaxID=511051 RepID=A0A7U6GDH0_CALEA|nr:ACP S-malonyltransferase [Caldisericum exile]BAL80307.1 malonyl CoA-acyl carrier protein transacylase [Caldisericum exile AZM16c01]